MSSPEGSTVTFHRAPASLRRGVVERFARKLQADVANGRPFDCLIAGDSELLRLNRQYRGLAYPTDVLSFPSGVVPQAASRVGLQACLGDIAISLPRARAQARDFGHTTEQEIQILMLHGLLHLLGMDHESDNGRMARAEKRWRTRFGLPNSLIERVRS